MNQIIVYYLIQPQIKHLDHLQPASLTGVAAMHAGVYTVARTYHGDKVLGFERHLARLEESACLMSIPLALDCAWLCDAICRCVHAAGFPDTRFCLSIPKDSPHTFYLALEPFREVPQVYRREGVSAATIQYQRQLPRAKSTEWITIREEARAFLPDDVYEGLLIDEKDRLLEGMSSNFYVVREGTLYTASEGVLGGIARAGVLEVAPEMVPVQMQALTLDDLPEITEAMLSSSSRGVVPVTQINGRPVGDGRPGPITQQLAKRYEDWAEAHLEPLCQEKQYDST